MMTVHKVGALDSVGYSAYLASRESTSRRGDYYVGAEGRPAEAQGYWHGRGAAELGLNGAVTRDALLRTSGEILVRRSAKGEHVAAIDCTFSAPKSVSVIWALSDAATRFDIESAQEQAVVTAIDHIAETVPLLRRRVGGDIVHERATGIVAARFRHHTARLSAEQHAAGAAPDPQLHDHVAIANMALCDEGAAEQSGLWGAIDSRELYRVAAEAGAVYRAELASRVRRLGFSVHREGRYFEVDGISPELRRAFSARTLEAEAATHEFVEENGRQPTDTEAKRLTVLSRGAKAAESHPAFPGWKRRARDVGIDPVVAEAVCGNAVIHQGLRSATADHCGAVFACLRSEHCRI